MWIILEGIDGSGKTTVAQALEERGWCYGHTGPPGQGGSFPELTYTWWNCENRLLDQAEHWVWDRGHLGELFCGPVRRGTTLTRAALNVFEAFLLDREAEIWWIDPPAERVQSEVDVHQRVSERLHLRRAVENSRVRVRRFNASQSALDYVAEMPQPGRLERRDPAGVGTRQPRWWVLGEQCSGKAICCLPFTTHAGLDMLWPWVEPTRERVSNVLLPQEDLTAARTGKFAPESLCQLQISWKLLREPRILTLGGTAEAACRAAGLPVTATLRHPNYIRRFYHQEVAQWSEAYREIVR